MRVRGRASCLRRASFERLLYLSDDPCDRRSMYSEAFGDLLHRHPGHVGVDEFLTLRVAQTSLRFECLGCDWAALITSGRPFGSSGGGMLLALTTGDECSERSGGV